MVRVPSSGKRELDAGISELRTNLDREGLDRRCILTGGDGGPNNSGLEVVHIIDPRLGDRYFTNIIYVFDQPTVSLKGVTRKTHLETS